MRLYDFSLSTSLPPSPMLLVDLQSYVSHCSPSSVILLHILTCRGLVPSPGRCLAPAGVLCVLSSLLTLLETSAVMPCLCEQRLLSGFLFLNKPKLRYEPDHIFRPNKSFDKNFHFVLYVDTF